MLSLSFQDHLACFMAGTLALGSFHGLGGTDHLELAEKIADTCWQTYRRMPTGLSPEITYFNLAPAGKEDLIVKVSYFYLDSTPLRRVGVSSTFTTIILISSLLQMMMMVKFVWH